MTNRKPGRAMKKPVKAVRRVARDLTGRADADLVKLIGDQLEATRAGVDLALQAVRGKTDPATARQDMAEIEHRGDDARATLVAVLRRSIASPIDREDLFRLSRSIDDVLDEIRDFVRGLDLLTVGDEPTLTAPLEAVADGVLGLEEAVSLLATQPQDISRAALSARKNAIRERYLEALAVVLEADESATNAPKLQELLRRVDVVGQRLGEAADVLSDAAMKRWYA